MGGRMRCEMSQKAMSLLPSALLKRRPMVWARMANTASAETTATSHGTPRRDGDEQARHAADEQADDAQARLYRKRTSA